MKPINRLIDKSRNGDVCLKNKNVIEVLYTEECPFWREVAKTIEEVLKESKITALVKRVKVSSEDEAKRLRFLGSPTVRINGVDIGGQPTGSIPSLVVFAFVFFLFISLFLLDLATYQIGKQIFKPYEIGNIVSVQDENCNIK